MLKSWRPVADKLYLAGPVFHWHVIQSFQIVAVILLYSFLTKVSYSVYRG
jgi:nucleoside 2-deoxyribosyltransferase